MSLINQVLKDIDKRNSTVEGHRVQPLYADVRVTPARNTPRLFKILIILVIFSAVIVTWQKYSKLDLNSADTSQQEIVSADPSFVKAAPIEPSLLAVEDTTFVMQTSAKNLPVADNDRLHLVLDYHLDAFN